MIVKAISIQYFPGKISAGNKIGHFNILGTDRIFDEKKVSHYPKNASYKSDAKLEIAVVFEIKPLIDIH
jgi:hypothetical protein